MAGMFQGGLLGKVGRLAMKVGSLGLDKKVFGEEGSLGTQMFSKDPAPPGTPSHGAPTSQPKATSPVKPVRRKQPRVRSSLTTADGDGALTGVRY